MCTSSLWTTRTLCKRSTRSLSRRSGPNARIRCFGSRQGVAQYVDTNARAGTPVNLVLLDLNLSEDEKVVPELRAVCSISNGFQVAADLDAEPSDVHKDLRFKPFVALITAFADDLTASSSFSSDGSILGCDAVLSKPCSAGSMLVLIEGCEVGADI